MKNLYQQFETNKEREQQGGFRLVFGGGEDAPVFVMRRAGGSNRKFQAVFNQKMRPYSRAIAQGTLGEEKGNEVLIDVYFEAVVTGWENVTDREGKPLEYNRANFTKLMKDLPELFSAIRDEAADIKNFQDIDSAQADGEAVGNS